MLERQGFKPDVAICERTARCGSRQLAHHLGFEVGDRRIQSVKFRSLPVKPRDDLHRHFHPRLIARLARTHRQDRGGVILASSSLRWRAHSDRWRSRRISERPIAVGPPPIARQALTCIAIQSATACDQCAAAYVWLDAPAGDEDMGQPLRAGRGVEHRHVVAP